MGHEVEFFNIKYAPKNKINKRNRQFLKNQKIKATGHPQLVARSHYFKPFSSLIRPYI
jgi:hypothetical protein